MHFIYILHIQIYLYIHLLYICTLCMHTIYTVDIYICYINISIYIYIYIYIYCIYNIIIYTCKLFFSYFLFSYILFKNLSRTITEHSKHYNITTNY